MNWLVLRVLPQKEFEAEKRIKDRGHEALCPFEKKWRRRNSRTKHKREWKYPCFSRYVFAGINNWPFDWIDIKDNVDVVQGCLGWGDRPAVLTSQDVLRLEQMAGGTSSTDIHKAIAVGSAATITEGPFNGYTVTVRSIVGNNANVVMQQLDSMSTVRISLAKLEAV